MKTLNIESQFAKNQYDINESSRKMANLCRLTRQAELSGTFYSICLVEQTIDDLKNSLPEGYINSTIIPKI
jgi:hypothetical protein